MFTTIFLKFSTLALHCFITNMYIYLFEYILRPENPVCYANVLSQRDQDGQNVHMGLLRAAALTLPLPTSPESADHHRGTHLHVPPAWNHPLKINI